VRELILETTRKETYCSINLSDRDEFDFALTPCCLVPPWLLHFTRGRLILPWFYLSKQHFGAP
jgi:hypothetical protein